jgi:hypothetical protein
MREKRNFYPIDKTLGSPENSHHNLCKSTHKLKLRFLEELDCGLHDMMKRRGAQRGQHVLYMNEHMKAGGAKLVSLS